MSNFENHRAILDEMHDLYIRKNRDYGDSFHNTFLEEGYSMARVRLSDKLNRFKVLSKQGRFCGSDSESVRDTLIDLANYAVMTVMEMDRLDADIRKSGDNMKQEDRKCQKEHGTACAASAHMQKCQGAKCSECGKKQSHVVTQVETSSFFLHTVYVSNSTGKQPQNHMENTTT